MSGRLPIHVNIQNAQPDIYNEKDPVSGMAGIPRNMTGMASKLKVGSCNRTSLGSFFNAKALLIYVQKYFSPQD